MGEKYISRVLPPKILHEILRKSCEGDQSVGRSVDPLNELVQVKMVHK